MTKPSLDCASGFSPLFHELSRADIEYLNAIMRRRTVAARSLVFAAKQQHQEVFILAIGQVKVCREDVLLNILGPGEVIGELSILGEGGHSADVWALVECDLHCIDSREFSSCLSSMPTLANNLLRIQAVRLKKLNERFCICQKLPVVNRVAWQLLVFANAYRHGIDQTDVVIPFPLSQTDLAQLIATTRESVNRVLCDFQNQRIVSIGQCSHITVHNIPALKRLSHNEK